MKQKKLNIIRAWKDAEYDQHSRQKNLQTFLHTRQEMLYL
jgi:hypothetical protein